MKHSDIWHRVESEGLWNSKQVRIDTLKFRFVSGKLPTYPSREPTFCPK